MSVSGAKDLPTYEEAVRESRCRRPAPGDYWWTSAHPAGYGQADGIQNATFTAGRDFRPDVRSRGNGLPSDVKQIPAPLALPGQFLVAKGVPARVYSVQFEQHFSRLGEWKYYTDAGPFPTADVEPHPRPDHGGSVLTTREVAQLKILERGDERLEKIQDALGQTLLLQQQTAVAEKARLDRIKREEVEARARETARLAAEEAERKKASSPLAILENTAQGAADGAAAAAFLYASRKLVEKWRDYIPSILLTERGQSALPWLLCVAAYLATLLLPGFPLGEQLRAMSLRATRGTATLMMAHLSESITPLMDRIIERGNTLLEKA